MPQLPRREVGKAVLVIAKRHIRFLACLGRCDTELEVGAAHALQLEVVAVGGQENFRSECRLETVLLVNRPAYFAWLR